MSTSKSSSLPETIIFYTIMYTSSLHTTGYAMKAEICLSLKCVTSHYSQKILAELQIYLQ